MAEDPFPGYADAEASSGSVEVRGIHLRSKVATRGYWVDELAMEGMCPCPFFHTQRDGLPVAMRILARSRDGHHVAASGIGGQDDVQVWSRDQQDDWSLSCSIPVHPDFIQGIIITDASQVTIEALTITSPGPHDLWLDGPLEERIQFAVPPRLVLVQLPEMLGILSLRRPEARWLPVETVEAQALGCYIKRHAHERRLELATAFAAQCHLTMDPADFTLTFHADPLTFPSILSTIKFNGRPSFCADKGPRVIRSPPLTEEEELEVSLSKGPMSFFSLTYMFLQGIFSLFVLLRALFSNKAVELWGCSLQTQTLFAKTEIYEQLAASKRTEYSTIVCQLRRWLPLCKLLGKLLRMKHPMHHLQEMKHAQDSTMRANFRWMNKRGCVLLRMIKDWIKVCSLHSGQEELLTWVFMCAGRRASAAHSERQGRAHPHMGRGPAPPAAASNAAGE